MNKHAPINRSIEGRSGLPTTEGADGLPRMKWNRTQIEAMVEAGIFAKGDRFELIEGEIVPMSPKGLYHERLKNTLIRYWGKVMPDDFKMLTESTVWRNEFNFNEPDFVFLDFATSLDGLSLANCHLAVEVAVSSFDYDTKRKAQMYASAGLPLYWVINAGTFETWIFSEPVDGQYPEPIMFKGDIKLTPPFAPELSVTLNNLTLV